jgi:hypothetical protein
LPHVGEFWGRGCARGRSLLSDASIHANQHTGYVALRANLKKAAPHKMTLGIVGSETESYERYEGVRIKGKITLILSSC